MAVTVVLSTNSLWDRIGMLGSVPRDRHFAFGFWVGRGFGFDLDACAVRLAS